MSPNWIDIIIISVVGYFLITGWEQGVIHLLASLVSFVLSLWITIMTHSYVAVFFTQKFGLPETWMTVISYVLVAFIAEAVLSTAFRVAADEVPIDIIGSKANHWLGGVVSVFNGLVIVTFLITLMLVLPVRGSVKSDIRSSMIGGPLTQIVERFGGRFQDSVTNAMKSAQQFLTVSPESGENVTLDLDISEDELMEARDAEAELVTLVNLEREKIGLSPLYSDSKISDVARLYSKRMVLTSHFSHIDTSGETAGNRLSTAGVVFVRAGENLAFAPDIETAHVGLMNSDKHRINILDRRFRRIGIGIIDAGGQGFVVTQLFAD